MIRLDPFHCIAVEQVNEWAQLIGGSAQVLNCYKGCPPGVCESVCVRVCGTEGAGIAEERKMRAAPAEQLHQATWMWLH